MSERKIFHAEDGKPGFEFSVCVFMDVLGFAESQKKSFENKTGLKEFQRFYSIIRSELDHLNRQRNEFADDPLWELKVFTDNIVLGYPIGDGEIQHAESEIGWATTAISYQLAMAREGYFVRGGLFPASTRLMDTSRRDVIFFKHEGRRKNQSRRC